MKFDERFERFKQAQAGAIQRTAKAITEAKGKWLREVMRAHLPRETFEMADSKKAEDLIALKNYLVAQSIQEQVLPDGSCQVVQGERVLGTFKVGFEEGKINVEAKVARKSDQSDGSDRSDQ